MYLVTAETFPTVCRSTAYSFVSFPGRVVQIVYPVIIQLSQQQFPWLSSLCLGVVSLSACIAALALHDTSNLVLLTTIEQTENYYKKKKSTLNKLCC